MLSILALLGCSAVRAQQVDTLQFILPNGVALRSALIPGWGQLVNRQWYKVPIIYAGGVGVGYVFYKNNQQYQHFRLQYRYRTDDDPATEDTEPQLTTQGILDARQYYKRNRDLTVIVTGAMYAANILDAYVFAHLREFDVDDKLSVRFSPAFGRLSGINLQLTYCLCR